MTVRTAVPDDAPAILRIAGEQGLPACWQIPADRHIVVAEGGADVVAFASLYESPYGLVCDDLWCLPWAEGERGLALLSRHIERLAQDMADRRGVALHCGGVVRLDREAHIAALKRRGYTEEATVLAKMFHPRERA